MVRSEAEISDENRRSGRLAAMDGSIRQGGGTGRVAVTSAAILVMLVDREPVLASNGSRKN